MAKMKVERVIKAPIARVSDALTDFANVHRFHPAVANSVATNGQSSGEGAERVCHLYDGTQVTERLTEARDGRWVIDIYENNIVRGGRAVVTATPESNNQTRIAMELEMRFAFPMSMMAPMIRMRFRGILLGLIEGLEQHLQTGRIIEKDGRLGGRVETLTLAAA